MTVGSGANGGAMTRDEVDAKASALYGAPLGPADGVLHVVAVARVDGSHRVLRIGEHSPRSATDFFALSLARARVDAIVISGSVLRAEPTLVYDRLHEGLLAIRGHREPPWLCVLTRSGDLPASHPAWESWARPLVYTSDDAALSSLPARVEIVRAASPSPRAAIHHLREDRGCAAVSIEAGPRVAVPLYDGPAVVDELMLSVFEGALDPRAVGGAFLDEAAIDARFERVGGPTRVDEPSGPWTFARYLSRARRGTAGGSRSRAAGSE